MTLSVIIPAYNAGAFLENCIGSVTGAFHSLSYEIVVVNDGSTDDTEEAIGRIEREHPCVKHCTQPNAGVSAARNKGLQMAQGEWVTFIDADDTVFQESGAVASFLAESTADVVVLRSFLDGRERYPWSHLFPNGSTRTAGEVLKKGYLRGSICGCIFRRRFLADGNISFPVGIRLSEDTVFFAETLSQARSFAFLDLPFYRVAVREGSASRSFRPEDVEAVAQAIDTARKVVPDVAVRNYTVFKLIITLTSRAVDCHIPAKSVYAMARLADVLPLSTKGIHTEKAKILLLNASYRLFYSLISLRNRLR